MSTFLLIISSQRTGSTLLCRDIYSLGSLGEPKEFALPYLQKTKFQSFSSDDFASMLDACRRQYNDRDIYSLKLMIDYSPRIINAIIAERIASLKPEQFNADSTKCILKFIQYLAEVFEKLIVVIHRRDDIVANVHSRVMASASGNHHVEVKNAAPNPPVIQKELLCRRMLAALPKAIRENEILVSLQAELNGQKNILSTEYEDLLDVDSWNSTLSTFLEYNGIDCSRPIARSLKKILPKDLQDQHCADFSDWLLASLGKRMDFSQPSPR